MKTFFFLALIFTTSAAVAKEERQYLYRIYTEASSVARVVVLDGHEIDGDRVEYQLRVLKPIKGLGGEKTIKVVLRKNLPVDAPKLAEGEVGIAFLQKLTSSGLFGLSRFLLSQDLVLDTSTFFCKPPGEYCQLTRASEVEDFLKNR